MAAPFKILDSASLEYVKLSRSGRSIVHRILDPESKLAIVLLLDLGKELGFKTPLCVNEIYQAKYGL